MHLATFRKERLQLTRKPWLAGVLVCFVGLTSYSVTLGIHRYEELSVSQRARQEEARRDWMEQKTGSAHLATHHGTSLYKVFSPLIAFDLGVDPFQGTAVRLESHRQQPMTDPLSAEIVDPLHFDVSSPALLLQCVLPLLMIFLTFSKISSEREQGTLSLILSSGGSWRRWVFAHFTVSFALTVFILLLPMGWIAVWMSSATSPPEVCPGNHSTTQILLPSGEKVAARPDEGAHVASASTSHRSNPSPLRGEGESRDRPPESFDTNLKSRFAFLLGCQLLFLGGWILLSLGISARAKSSRVAFVLLLSFWTGWCVVMPRLAVEFARHQAPLPLQEDLVRDSRTQVKYADEPRASAKIHADLEAKLFAEYGVSSRKDLPLNWGGASMIALEEHTDQLYDAQAARLNDIFVKQDQILNAAVWISPFLAMRAASSAFAGTDRRHHQAFYDAAEQYRRKLVLTMNQFDMARIKPTSAKSGPEVWGLVPAFQYEFPDVQAVAERSRTSLIVLVVWFFGTGLFALIAPARM